MDFSDIDFSDRKTQITAVGIALVIGLVLARLRGSSTPGASGNPENTFVIEYQGEPGGPAFNGTFPTAPPIVKAPEKEAPKPAGPTFNLSEAVVVAGTRVNAVLSGFKMNDQIDVYLNNTSSTPLRTYTVSASGAVSGGIPIPKMSFDKGQAFTVGSLVAVNRRDGTTLHTPIRITKPAGQAGDVPLGDYPLLMDLPPQVGGDMPVNSTIRGLAPVGGFSPIPAGVHARREVMVRRNDSLATIAGRELGSPGRWPALLAANPQLANVTGIRAGEILQLP